MLPERDGVVVFSVLGGEDERDVVGPGVLDELLERSRMRLELPRVTPPELVPPLRSCPNHFLSAVLGATSFSQASTLRSSLVTPRGQMRSTRTR
jgi:hypothetical protein